MGFDTGEKRDIKVIRRAWEGKNCQKLLRLQQRLTMFFYYWSNKYLIVAINKTPKVPRRKGNSWADTIPATSAAKASAPGIVFCPTIRKSHRWVDAFKIISQRCWRCLVVTGCRTCWRLLVCSHQKIHWCLSAQVTSLAVGPFPEHLWGRHALAAYSATAPAWYATVPLYIKDWTIDCWKICIEQPIFRTGSWCIMEGEGGILHSCWFFLIWAELETTTFRRKFCFLMRLFQ